MNLDCASILVVDDQTDVARTLCEPLKRAQATVVFAEDGHAAMKQLEVALFDLVVMDMRMPPGDWGGVWLLRQMRERGWTVPVIVLTGEGYGSHTKEVIRLGPAAWIEKESAVDELATSSFDLIRRSHAEAVDAAASTLPSPLAVPLRRYQSAEDPAQRAFTGYLFIESVLRLIGVLALASSGRLDTGIVELSDITSPSVGTWVRLCRSVLMDPGQAPAHVVRLISALSPRLLSVKDKRRLVEKLQSLAKLRNDMAHRGRIPDPDECLAIDRLIQRCGHVIRSQWKPQIVVPTAMTFNGSGYLSSTIECSDAARSGRREVATAHPLVSGHPLLVEGPEVLQSLDPWMITDPGHDSDLPRLFLFDGIERQGATVLEATARLRYYDVLSGESYVPSNRDDCVLGRVSAL